MAFAIELGCDIPVFQAVIRHAGHGEVQLFTPWERYILWCAEYPLKSSLTLLLATLLLRAPSGCPGMVLRQDPVDVLWARSVVSARAPHPPCAPCPGSLLPAGLHGLSWETQGRKRSEHQMEQSRTQYKVASLQTWDMSRFHSLKKAWPQFLCSSFVGEKVFYCQLGIMTFPSQCALLCVQILHG